MAHLFEPLTLRGVTFAHRIFVSPMCQYSSVEGRANDWHLVHLGSRAVGRAAAVITEAAAVTADGRISPDDLGIWSDDHIEPLARVFRFISAQGSVPGIQLAYAGRKASTAAPWLGGKPLAPEDGGWKPILAPSAIPFAEGYQVPTEMTGQQISSVTEAFAAATRRAFDAGAKVIEIHAAHGYLLHEFLSPLSNHRSDEYGGTFEKRTRMLREVVQAVRREWPDDLPLFVRISQTDWVEGGWTLDDSVELAHKLKEWGVDLIDCSSGGNFAAAKIPVGAGYQVAGAERIRRETGVATGAVGMITAAMQADQIIRLGQADAVFLAREFLRDPYFPLHAASAVHKEINWPVQYERARL
ncbi:MAG: NADH:flavin oxidoreductase/NADH oxidase [Terriglobales bacterium]